MPRLLLLLLLLVSASGQAQAGPYPAPLKPKAMLKHPYDLIGQLFFKSGRTEYIGSGTIIGARSVLTAGHNLYDQETGFSTAFEFHRATYGRAGDPVRQPSHRYLLAGYRANADARGGNAVQSFAYDASGLVFATALYGGAKAPYIGDRGYLNLGHAQVLVGYGAEGSHNGNYPLFVTPTRPFFSTYGSFYENTSLYVEGGMSGGPFLSLTSTGTLLVLGVVVSGSTDPISGGVRLLDPALLRFIKTALP